MKKVITIIMTMVLTDMVSAFVLMGPTPNQNENTLNTAGTSPPTGIAGHFQAIQSSNLEDAYLGTPKDRTRFFRVNSPYLTYGFDQTFMQFFGLEGINAIDEAMTVINDFFEPEDKTYDGMSGPTGLDLTLHGFSQNYATYWLNTTAEVDNLIDIKSVTLGYMVNRLGLGNPHRYAYTTYELDANLTGSHGMAVWKTKLNNYDPLDPINIGKTDIINNVQYSYRLIHNKTPGINLTTWVNADWTSLIADMEEYTDDTSGNAWSAVAAIVDAFYGNTQLTWITPPSQFNFGVYYDGMNAAGGQYKPRHALTFDDAGGLKYLYSTNTIAMEFNPYRAVSPADYVKAVQNAYGEHNALASGSGPGHVIKPGNEVRLGGNPYQPIYNPTPRSVFPIRNGGGVTLAPGNPNFPLSANNPLYHLQSAPNIGSFMDGSAFTGVNVGKMAWAYRGGINKIKMVKLNYDSLLDTTPDGAAFVWKDTFITNLNVDLPNTSGVPGAGYNIAGRPQYFTQIVGRNVTVPDFLFSARNLTPINGIPVAFEENGTFDFDGGNAPTVGGIGAAGFLAPTVYATGNNDLIADASWTTGGIRANPQASRGLGAANNGPGIWAPAETTTTFTLTFNSEHNIGGYEVVWQGEVSVDGNSTAPPVVNQQWAHIYGPGLTDFKKFPDNIAFMGAQSYYSEWENSVLPVAGKPDIAVVSKNGGTGPIGNNSFHRTQDSMTIRGSSFRNATAVQILGPQGDTVQLIYPVSAYIKSDSLIEIPKEIVESGTQNARNVIGFESEGADRRLVVWNTVGASEMNPNPFAVKTGRVVLSGTSHDGTVYYRDGPLTLYGYGFKSAFLAAEDGNSTVTSIMVLDAFGNPVWPAGGAMVDISSHIQVVSDNKIVVNASAFNLSVDGLNRVIRVARSTTPTLSLVNGKSVTFAASKPIVTDLICTYSANSYIDAANATVVPALDLTVTDGSMPTENPLRRDEVITITGTGFTALSKIWLVTQAGAPFNPPVEIDSSQFGIRGVVVNALGTQITISANVPGGAPGSLRGFVSSGADGFGSKVAMLRLNNNRDNSNLFGPFNVNIQPTVTGITGLGTYDANTTFNRGSIDPFTGFLIGNLVSITGTGLDAIEYVRIQATDSLDIWRSPPSIAGALPTGNQGANIALPVPTLRINSTGSTPGVNVDLTGQTLRVQTGANSGFGSAVFTSGAAADADALNRYMQFKLQCEDRNRTIAFTPNALGSYFIVGISPTVQALTIPVNFKRDADNATMTGTGLRLIDELEFVDQNNISIVGAGTDLTFYPEHVPPGSTLIDVNPNGLRVDFNGSVIAWANVSRSLADNVQPGSRLIKLTTPWGNTRLHTLLPAIQPFRISGAIQFSPIDDPNLLLQQFAQTASNDRWSPARLGPLAGWGTLQTDANTSTFTSNSGQPAANILGSMYGQATGGTGVANDWGGGWDWNGTDAVNRSGGVAANTTGLSNAMADLFIWGSGFRGVSAIEFRDSRGAGNNLYQWPNATVMAIDPQAGTPAGITVNANGTMITISGTYIHAGNNTWARQGENLTINGPGQIFRDSRYIRLYTPSGDWNDTPLLDTNATL